MSRVLNASGRVDPLELHRETFDFEGETKERRVADLIRAALGGTLPIDARHPRADLHPVTREMLRISGVDPDAFAALAALRVQSGLYVDGPSGRTLAKAVYVDNQAHGDPLYPHVRTHILDKELHPRITWWQHENGRFEMKVSALPEMVAATLIGEPLSKLMADPAEGRHDLIIREVDVHDLPEGLRSIVRLSERKTDHP